MNERVEISFASIQFHLSAYPPLANVTNVNRAKSRHAIVLKIIIPNVSFSSQFVASLNKRGTLKGWAGGGVKVTGALSRYVYVGKNLFIPSWLSPWGRLDILEAVFKG